MTEDEGSSQFVAQAAGLFDETAMAEIAKMLRITNPNALLDLQQELIAACAHYREVIATLPCDLPDAPINMSLTKRGDWLETNIINPAERLIAGLADQNRPMFSTWPYPLSPPTFRDNASLLLELHDLLEHATLLRDSLRGQQADDAGHSQELRAEVFISVVETLRKYPLGVAESRGVYVPEERRRIGSYVDAVRFIFRKIAGVEENLDRLIRQETRLTK